MSFVTQNFWQTFKPVELIDKARGYFLLGEDVVIPNTWLGASQVLFQYNYVATGNFTMDELPDLSGYTLAGVVLCIRYTTDNGHNVVRYKLNAIDGDSVYFPMYTGQIILAGFTIEIWSGIAGSSSGIGTNTPPQFNISILHSKVILTDDDTFEDCTPAECNSMSSTNGLNLPLQFTQCAIGSAN